MKLLVLAQTPPPLHGQSIMVQTMLAGLARRREFTLFHVNLPLSRDAADIGRIRPRKLRVLLRACREARRLAAEHDIDTLYYVPAPGKRAALYRDWIAMRSCRPRFRHLVLHWHAAGLAEWLDSRALGWERAVTRRLLGGADLSIVLAGSLRADAEYLAAKRIVVVPNGIIDPGPPTAGARRRSDPFRVLFVGLCSKEKGLFAAAAAVLEANRRSGAPPGAPLFTLTAAGAFPDQAAGRRFAQMATEHPATLCHAGVVTGEAKQALLFESHALCLPTRHPYEAQPLVLLEAMACDLPIIATRWRGIPETVPAVGALLVDRMDITALAQALMSLRASPPKPGVLRDHFLAHFTHEHHLATLAAALQSLPPNPG
jgi:glycosyltransferase involved in cell wall biosynthesis